MEKNRKKYEPPSIESETVLESAALACGKCVTGSPTGAAAPSCRALRKLS